MNKIINSNEGKTDITMVRKKRMRLGRWGGWREIDFLGTAKKKKWWRGEEDEEDKEDEEEERSIFPQI